jgi:hypothetical protein
MILRQMLQVFLIFHFEKFFRPLQHTHNKKISKNSANFQHFSANSSKNQHILSVRHYKLGFLFLIFLLCYYVH